MGPHFGILMWFMQIIAIYPFVIVIPRIYSNHNRLNDVAIQSSDKFSSSSLSYRTATTRSSSLFLAAKGFGSSNSSPSLNKKKKNPRFIDTFEDDNESKTKKAKKGTTFIKSEQEDLIASLTAKASKTCIGQAVAESMKNAAATGEEMDPFWELMPSLLSSRFPSVRDNELQRIAGFIRHTLNPKLIFDDDEIVNNPYRPEQEMHAYMPGLGPTKPFYDPSQLQICQLLSDNYETIKNEYNTLIDYLDNTDSKKFGFQSVTSLNYDSGWKTLVLYYNGHRIDGFPYHLCPTTTRILETVPIAGRIAGFNRQQPLSGIPLHTDGNNMWLTCQMGIKIPEQQKAYIRVGPETQRWDNGTCLVYDTTYEHETYNEHPTMERIVLHVDFFNTLAMTPIEIEIMQYIYSLREQFMKAEGITKVGEQTL